MRRQSPVRIADARQRCATAHLRDRLPPSRPFERWLRASGEAAPDFAALPARAELWSPVAGLRGPQGWPARREEIRAQWRRWLLGDLPSVGADGREARVDRAAGGRLLLHSGDATVRARLLLPASAAEPQPILLVPSSHLAWARAALRRGWAACVVSASDGDDDSAALAPAGSMLARRAAALSLAVDALHALPEVDPARIVVAGHSRNGKAALIAAAFDERIAAAVSSSSGVLGAMPARLCADRHGGEGIELLTRHFPDWYHQRLRFFSGREHQLPTDAHELLACAAPRPVLVSVGVRDQVESTWAAERSVAAAREAFALLGAPEALTLRWRAGQHRVSDAAVEGYLDWAEAALAGRPADHAGPRHDPSRRPWPAEAVAHEPRPAFGRGFGAPAAWRRSAPPVEWLGPRGGGRPVVLWLPPLCRPTGWRIGYEQAVPLPELLAQAGFAVACHDLAGTGARQAEDADLRGMVADARAVLDVVDGPAWVAGYGAGALVGAHLAATDRRILGAALVAPLTGDPVLGAGDAPTRSLADLLLALRPRPVLLATPLVDPVCPPATYAAAARSAGVEHLLLDDHHRFSAETRFVLRAWLASVARPQHRPVAA
jgi:alpha/beta superfamily hydrolase